MVQVYLEPCEIERMEKQANCARDQLLIRLLFRLGCRISEALALRIEDIDFGQGTVTIEHLKVRPRLSCPECSARLGKSHAFCPGCGSKVEKTFTQEQQERRRSTPVSLSYASLISSIRSTRNTLSSFRFRQNARIPRYFLP